MREAERNARLRGSPVPEQGAPLHPAPAPARKADGVMTTAQIKQGQPGAKFDANAKANKEFKKAVRQAMSALKE